MSTKSHLVCMLAAASVLTTGVYAIPQPLRPTPIGSTLIPRIENNYVGCSEDQKAKLGIAFADATALAGIAFGYNPDQGISKTSTAFQHYFREEDFDNSRSLYGMITSNNDPTNAPFSFSVRCGTNDDEECKAPKGGKAQTVAVTDSQPDSGEGEGRREMKICPLFFTADQTTRSLNSKEYNDKRGGWCVTGQKFGDFETGGHTLLHEMTHLDAIGKAAGLPERDDPSGFKTHGTDDVDGFGEDYTPAARDLKTAWTDSPDDLAPGALQPWQNAENIAAAAT
ncbi:MAG: hypothetical protein L6R38_009609, partial [Xanthoria sp. 2 TBL-2021]